MAGRLHDLGKAFVDELLIEIPPLQERALNALLVERVEDVGDVAVALDGGGEAFDGEGVGDGELLVECAFVSVLELHEDAVVGPAQAFDARRAFVGSVEGDGALQGAEADAEVGGEVGEDGVVVPRAGVELFLGDAFADGPVAFN